MKKLSYKFYKPQDECPLLEESLLKLYKTPFSDIRYLTIYGNVNSQSLHKLYLYEDGVLNHLLLLEFINNGREVVIHNSVIILEECMLDYTLSLLWGERAIIAKECRKVTTRGTFYVANKYTKIPHVLYSNPLNDAVINLPLTSDEYYESLGNSTRKNAKYYKRRLAKDYPDLKIDYLRNSEINYSDVENLIAIKRKRAESIRRKCDISEIDIHRIVEYAKLYGFICKIQVKGELIAGMVNYIIDDECFCYVIAHAPNFSKYNAGQLSLIYTLEYLIEHQLKKCHLLWGANEYKYRFGCQDYNLFKITIWKSPFEFLGNRIYSDIRYWVSATLKGMTKLVLKR